MMGPRFSLRVGDGPSLSSIVTNPVLTHRALNALVSALLRRLRLYEYAGATTLSRSSVDGMDLSL